MNSTEAPRPSKAQISRESREMEVHDKIYREQHETSNSKVHMHNCEEESKEYRNSQVTHHQICGNNQILMEQHADDV